MKLHLEFFLISVLVMGLFSFPTIIPDSNNSGIIGTAFGQSELEDGSSGVMPDNFLYGLDVAFDNLRLAFASGDFERAKISLEIAEERLLEVKTMIEQNKITEAQIAQQEHDSVLEVTEESVEQIEHEDESEQVKEELEIENELKEHKNKVENVSENLKVTIKIKGEISDSQQVMVDSVLSQMEGKTGELEIKIDNKKQETRIKFKEKSEVSDFEFDEEGADSAGSASAGSADSAGSASAGSADSAGSASAGSADSAGSASAGSADSAGSAKDE